MVLIPGGEFNMGSEANFAFPNEKPVHRVKVAPFFLDVHPVTNAEFAEFVGETGYKTVAERGVDWEEMKKQLPPGTPKPPDGTLQPGSLVFRPTSAPVDLRDMSQWWVWTVGASWKHPEGEGSSIQGRENHPVVQIAWEDAQAYAKWAGKRLPTEAEWEFAARGGHGGWRYAWGDSEKPDGKIMLNRWTGDFPYRNDGADGFVGTSPVGSFPPNDYGLFDMGGNVWNWCSDIYRADTFAARAEGGAVCCDPQGPLSPAGEKPMPGDPSPPTVPGAERRVIKGGSFLCHPSYCESYRPSARRGTSPDTGSSHVGFRCAMDVPAIPETKWRGSLLPMCRAAMAAFETAPNGPADPKEVDTCVVACLWFIPNSCRRTPKAPRSMFSAISPAQNSAGKNRFCLERAEAEHASSSLSPPSSTATDLKAPPRRSPFGEFNSG